MGVAPTAVFGIGLNRGIPMRACVAGFDRIRRRSFGAPSPPPWTHGLNPFGELKSSLAHASQVLRRLTPTRIKSVRQIEFEHSPGRGDPRYTADRSAFDVYVEYEGVAGGRGFLGLKVNYHEDLNDALAPHRNRYDQVAQAMKCFHPDRLPDLRQKPINQLRWDHMLAGSMLLADSWAEGMFVILHPADNSHAAAAIQKYRACLADSSTFAAWPLESFVMALKSETGADWVARLQDRYLPT